MMIFAKMSRTTIALFLFNLLMAASLNPVSCQLPEEGRYSPLEVLFRGEGETSHSESTESESSDLDGLEHETDALQASCRLAPVVHILHHPGCQMKAIASFACAGSCHSYVKASASKFWQHERSCSCCTQTGFQEATFTLDCPVLDPPYRKVRTYAPIDCLCRSCSNVSRDDIKPQELVEALSNELRSDSMADIMSGDSQPHTESPIL